MVLVKISVTDFSSLKAARDGGVVRSLETARGAKIGNTGFSVR